MLLYELYEAQVSLLKPWRLAGEAALPWLRDSRLPFGNSPLARQWAAAIEAWNLWEVTHACPDWGITESGGVPVVKDVAARTPFGTLLRFRRAVERSGPKVLLVAPLSGHFATLLRDTLQTLVADHEVYVTDWHSAREVPLAAGRFGLDEYIGHVIDFLATIGPPVHVVAICQPCVAALAATALMAEDQHPATPASLTLMAGPIDCRVAPTRVNQLATERDIAWFRSNLIHSVPLRCPGAGRQVYPGFVQLTAFMSMNLERHLQTLREHYAHLVLDDDPAKVAHTREFYLEYFAVLDLPAEFYLETVERVFQTYELPRGELRYQGRRVDPAAIRRTALLTVEGERDDICSIGQTVAAQDLCSSVRPYMRRHLVQAGVGHYGVFSGRRWQGQIYPAVRETIQLFEPA